MAERVIDAKNAIVGRLATVVAKAALMGDSVKVVNCEHAVISGTKVRVMARERQRHDRGIPSKGPFISRLPDRYVRRIIRGMLPYKQAKGDEAFKRVMCYLGVPEELKEKKVEVVETALVSRLRGTGFITIQTICKELGGKR